MREFVLEELERSADWRIVLNVYQSRSSELKFENSAAEGWLPRVSQIEGIEPAHLSRLHGRLIALGLLEFEVSGKAGMQYQLSQFGRDALARSFESPSLVQDTTLSDSKTHDELD